MLAAGSGAPWSRGSSYAALTFDAGCKNYTFSYGPNTLHAAEGSLANVTGCASTVGADGQGPFSELELSFGAAGALAVRYYARPESFVFQRRPKTLALPLAWPAFSTDGYPEGPDKLKLRCLGWGETYFFPGGVKPRTAHTNPQPFTLKQCGSGGPMFVFGVGTGAGHAFALSPLDNFTTASVEHFSVTAGQGGCKNRCALFPSSAVLLARPGLVRATRAFGAVLRQWHGTFRLRGPGVKQLSYWNDNQAGYSWWTVGSVKERRTRNRNKKGVAGPTIFLISLAHSCHARCTPVGRACRQANELGLAAAHGSLNGSFQLA